MEIYEIGNLVKGRILGLTLSEIKERDYLCVLNNTSLSVRDGVQKMIEKLPRKDVKSIDWDNAVVSYGDGSNYTLATEKILKDKDKTIINVSNLLRYIYSRDFTIDMLYYNKEEGIVDLSGNAVEDVQNRFVRTVIPFRKLIAADNTVLLKAIEYRVCDNFRFSNEIDDTLRDRVDYIKPLDGTNEIFNRILNGGFSTMRNFFYAMERYPSVEEYFSISSGLQVSSTFSPTKKATEEYKRSNVFNMKKPKKKSEISESGLSYINYHKIKMSTGRNSWGAVESPTIATAGRKNYFSVREEENVTRDERAKKALDQFYNTHFKKEADKLNKELLTEVAAIKSNNEGIMYVDPWRPSDFSRDNPYIIPSEPKNDINESK